MDGLATLIKIQKSRVDEQQQILARLQTHLDRIELAITRLHEQQESEKEYVHQHPENTSTFGDYIKLSMRQMEALEKSRQTAIQSVEMARDKLASVFEEQKRYEIALQNKEDEAARQEERRDVKNLDEIGSQAFLRKQRG